MRISATPMRKYAYQGGTFILYRFELSQITHFNIWPDILAERQRACYWRWYLYQRAVGYYLKPQMPFCVQVCFVFTAVFVYREVFAVCKPQRFYSVYRRICFRSRRLGIQIRGLYRFLSKATHIQGSYNSLSSVFRLLLIEAITFPFHRQKSKYSLSIFLSPRSIFCNNRLLRNFLLSPSTLYGPTL